MSVKTGKVKEVTASASGSSAKLHFDDPPPEGHDELWTDPPDRVWQVLVACYTKGSDCEVTYDDTSGAKTAAKGK